MSAANRKKSTKAVSLGFHKKTQGTRVGTGRNTKNLSLTAADPSEGISLTNQYLFYSTTIDVGTPGQEVDVAVDTGSFYLWVWGPQDTKNNAPQFDPSKSSTYQDENQAFDAGYGAGSVTGEWSEDTVTVDGSSASKFPLGVVSADQLSPGAGVGGIVGLSPGVETKDKTASSYLTLPIALYQQKVTTSPAFSLFLQSGGTGGGIIFGGLDTTKFTGAFYTYDILSTNQLQDGGDYVFYSLEVDSVEVSGTQVEGKFQPIFDSGSPVSVVPSALVSGLKGHLPSQFKYNSQNGIWYAPKGTTGSGTSITVNIGKFTAEIPLGDLLVPYSYVFGTQSVSGISEDDVIVALTPDSSGYILGDAFFKNVYAVLDPENKTISFAKPTNDFTTSTLEDLPAGGGVPNSTSGL